MPFGWEGEKVRLVPLEKDKHFDNCVRWINDPQITAWTVMGDFPLTRLAEQEFFDRMSRHNETDVVLAIETLEQDEEHIGIIGINDISFRHGVGTVGFLIGRKQLWGRGYGSDAIAILSRYAFEVLGLRLLLSEVMTENIGSLKALLKNGYGEIGRIPERYWKRGAHRDSIQMILVRDEWKANETTETR